MTVRLLFVGPIIPKYYFVPESGIEQEKKNPGSVERMPSDQGSEEGNLFLWGQSVLLITYMLSK